MTAYEKIYSSNDKHCLKSVHSMTWRDNQTRRDIREFFHKCHRDEMYNHFGAIVDLRNYATLFHHEHGKSHSQVFFLVFDSPQWGKEWLSWRAHLASFEIPFPIFQ